MNNYKPGGGGGNPNYVCGSCGNYHMMGDVCPKLITPEPTFTKEDITRAIGMMRQWINEDLRRPSHRPITNKDLLIWFDNLEEKHA